MERLTGISGNMFSGKTAELIQLIERAEMGEIKVQVFKPIIDKRWGLETKIKSHSGAEHDAIPVNKSSEILERLETDVKIVAIDEAQFFDEEIVDVVDELLHRDIQVIVSGLPLDFRGEEFGPMPRLLARSDSLVRLTAVCKYVKDNGKVCGQDATRTQRIINGKPASYEDPIILIGAEESYEARCLNHHDVPGKPERRFK